MQAAASTCTMGQNMHGKWNWRQCCRASSCRFHLRRHISNACSFTCPRLTSKRQSLHPSLFPPLQLTQSSKAGAEPTVREPTHRHVAITLVATMRSLTSGSVVNLSCRKPLYPL